MALLHEEEEDHIKRRNKAQRTDSRRILKRHIILVSS